MKMMIVAAALATLAGLAPAAAAPITYTLAGTIAGTLDGGEFGGTAVFTGVGDTSTLVTGGTFVVVTLSSLKLVSGGVSYTVITPSEFFANVNGVSGFSSSETFDFLDFSAPELASYTAVTSLAETPVTLDFTTSFVTDRGEIDLASATDLVFSASVAAVPEPATWSLMVTGFAVTGVGVRRRRRAAALA